MVAARLASPVPLPPGVPGDVVRFEQQPLAVLLAAAPDRAAALAAAVLGPVLDLSPEDRAVILQTAHTWLATGGSSSAAADRCTSTATRSATGCAGSRSSRAETWPDRWMPPRCMSRWSVCDSRPRLTPRRHLADDVAGDSVPQGCSGRGRRPVRVACSSR